MELLNLRFFQAFGKKVCLQLLHAFQCLFLGHSSIHASFVSIRSLIKHHHFLKPFSPKRSVFPMGNIPVAKLIIFQFALDLFRMQFQQVISQVAILVTLENLSQLRSCAK